MNLHYACIVFHELLINRILEKNVVQKHFRCLAQICNLHKDGFSSSCISHLLARISCVFCNPNEPSQAGTQPITVNPPTTHLYVFANYFGGWDFLLSGWDWDDGFGIATGSPVGGAAALVQLLLTYIGTFGVHDKISSDGAAEHAAVVTEKFLRTLGSIIASIRRRSSIQWSCQNCCQDREKLADG